MSMYLIIPVVFHNGFMEELNKHGVLKNLSAYSGWNTADNTIGYALS